MPPVEDGGRSVASRRLEIVRAAAEKANLRVLALRGSRYGPAGDPAPVSTCSVMRACARSFGAQEPSNSPEASGLEPTPVGLPIY